MNPSAEKFESLLSELELDTAKTARLLGTTVRSVNRYRTGERTAPTPIIRFLRYIIATKAEPAKVNEVLK
jgi:DNA-binding transcriptional regulator YiaG